ncbi:uncharacterized protein METZ01_LOCUS381600, partial [marine metagenome]
MSSDIRHDWTLDEVEGLYNKPLMDLVFDAAAIHRAYHDSTDIQKC